MVRHFLEVDGSKINISKINDKDYFCLTDMVKNIEGGQSLIEKWLRNKNTLEFLGVWEMLNNPSFNLEEYERIQSDAGLNRFVISAKQWAQRTNAIGIAANPSTSAAATAALDSTRQSAVWRAVSISLGRRQTSAKAAERRTADCLSTSKSTARSTNYYGRTAERGYTSVTARTATTAIR